MKGGEKRMMKKTLPMLALLILIAFGVVINVVNASVWWCEGASEYCQGYCQGYFVKFNCYPNFSCNWEDKCEFACCYPINCEDFGGECCER